MVAELTTCRDQFATEIYLYPTLWPLRQDGLVWMLFIWVSNHQCIYFAASGFAVLAEEASQRRAQIFPPHTHDFMSQVMIGALICKEKETVWCICRSSCAQILEILKHLPSQMQRKIRRAWCASRPPLLVTGGHALKKLAKVHLWWLVTLNEMWLASSGLVSYYYPPSPNSISVAVYGHSVLAETTRGGSSESWQRQCNVFPTLFFSINFFHAQLWFNSTICIQANIQRHLPKRCLNKGLSNGNI